MERLSLVPVLSEVDVIGLIDMASADADHWCVELFAGLTALHGCVFVGLR